MREMRWTYDQLQATPVQVRAYCWDCIRIEREIAAERAQKAEREAQGEPGAIRIQR